MRPSAGVFRSSATRCTSTRARRARCPTTCARPTSSTSTGWDAHGAEWEHWVERSEAARAAFAALLGAETDDVAIQTSVSAAVSGLVSALPLRRRPEPHRHLRVRVPDVGQIAHAQELRGAEVVHVDGSPESFAAAVDERTALVCATFLSFRSGGVHDVEAIYAVAREHGALMLVDAYQAVGALPVEAAKVGDVVVGGTVKYLLASAGLSFMACRPGLVTELLPTQTGWFADENVFDMQIERYRPHASARRFDAGTPPVPNIYAGLAGVELIASVGVPAIAAHVRGLVDRFAAGLEELGASVAAPPRGPLVCVRSTDAPALVAALGAEDIVTSERDSNLRVSLHLYNTDEDVDAVLGALARHRTLLA